MSLLQPNRFLLFLERPEERELKTGVDAVCVVTTDLGFTEQIQSNIKFSVSSKEQEQKVRVPLCQELCGLSEDLKEFRIVFSLSSPGLYKVIVKLGDSHVTSSPLQFHVAARPEANPAPAILQSVTTMASCPGEEGVSHLDLNSNPKLEACSNNTSKSETFFLTPEQSLELEEEEMELGETESYLPDLLEEREVARKAGLNICLNLLEVEISRVRGVKVEPLEESGKKEESQAGKNNIDFLEGKKRKTKSMVGQKEVLQEILQQEEAVEMIMDNSMVESSLPTPCQPKKLFVPNILEKKGTVSRSLLPVTRTSRATSKTGPEPATIGPLDLAKSFTMLKASKILAIPMSREQSKSPDQSLNAPIGMCLLRNGNIVVASTFDDKVKIFCPAGKFLSLVTPVGMGFFRPSDMVSLRGGDFVVRDNNRLRLFSSEGTFISSIWEDRSATKCYGLAEDDMGRLVSIKKSGKETDLLFFDIEAGKIVKRMSLDDIILDKVKSKCRFLTFQGGNLYITDLGLDQVYVIDSETYKVILKFGKSGSEPDCLDDPAGLGVDSKGNMVVADSKNHRLCVYSSEGQFQGKLRLPEVRRPSGLLLVPDSKELFVLNLAGAHALVKYRLSA